MNRGIEKGHLNKADRNTSYRHYSAGTHIYGREARLARIRRQRRKAQVRRRLLLLAAALLLTAMAGFTLTGFAGYSREISVRETYSGGISSGSTYRDRLSGECKYYTAVTVQVNDTLWSIAQEYKPQEYSSIRDYLKEIREVNGMKGDRIYYGQKLILPYYSSVKR